MAFFSRSGARTNVDGARHRDSVRAQACAEQRTRSANKEKNMVDRPFPQQGRCAFARIASHAVRPIYCFYSGHRGGLPT